MSLKIQQLAMTSVGSCYETEYSISMMIEGGQ